MEAGELYRFSMYGVGMLVPGDWIMYPENRGQEFSFKDGFVKFEKRGRRIKKGEEAEGEGSVSVGLRWSTPQKDMNNDQFIQSYVDQLIASDEKKRFGRVQKTLKILDKKRIEVDGKESVFLECEYLASTKLRGNGAKPVHVLNLAFFDEGSNRIIIGTAMAQDATMMSKKPLFIEILNSIVCNSAEELHI